MSTTTVSGVWSLPGSPYNGTGVVGVLITNGVPSYFSVIGANLNQITQVVWYPKSPTSLKWTMRPLILVDNTQATFGITVTENYLNNCDRAGYIAFILDDGTNITFPVITYGPLAVGPLWQAPGSGLSTG